MFRSFAVACVGLSIAACGAEKSTTPHFDDVPFATTASADGDFTVAVQSSPASPPPRGVDALQFTITDMTGAPVDGLTVTLEPWMPDMGHGTSKPTMSALGDGKYLAEEVNLYMPGRWQLKTSIAGAVSDSVIVEAQVP